VYVWLDFKITFKRQEYDYDKNDHGGPELQLIYPDDYNSSQFFPMSVGIDEVDITATGESQTVYICT